MMAEIKQCGTHSKFQVKNKKKKNGRGGEQPISVQISSNKTKKKGDRATFSRFIMEFVTKVYTLQARFHLKKLRVNTDI